MSEPSVDSASTITVFLADDNLLVREGVRALIDRQSDLQIVGVGSDYDETVAGATATAPNVLVTDIRMPPSFNREGIDAAKEVRKRHPGTGIVILSQYDDPEYAVALLAEGSAGYGYLLKDNLAQGDQLIGAIRMVATGGTALDPSIVESLMRPVTSDSELSNNEESLLAFVAEGKPIKAIAAARRTTPEAIDAQVEDLFRKLAAEVSAGHQGALDRLRNLHRAIVDREEQGETLSRLLPGGIAEKLRNEGRRIGETERLNVTVIMSDIRSYSTIAEHADPSELAGQLNTHRAAMNRAIIGEGGTVMQFVGDAVMAVFGAPVPSDDHADRAVVAAAEHARPPERDQRDLGRRGTPGLRSRHRPLHGRGRRRASRIRRTTRVHARRRHGQPDPATPTARVGRRDGDLGTDQERAGHSTSTRSNSTRNS